MFIDGVEVIDTFSFAAGYVFCIVSDVILSLVSFLLQKSFEIRERRKFKC